jgi:hypothetical protein
MITNKSYQPPASVPLAKQRTYPEVSLPSASKPTLSRGNSTKDSGIKEVDVNKLDTNSLQDVIKYSGVDLKEEAENILRESDMLTQHSGSYSVDIYSNHAQLVNQAVFRAKIAAAMKEKGVKNVNDDVYDYMAIALIERMRHITEELIKISHQRVDHRREMFKWKAINDPKKQVWMLDKYENDLNKPKEEGEEEPQVTTEGKKPKKMKKTNEKEDVAVKTKLTNSTALAALGMTRKSWMTQSLPKSDTQASSFKESKTNMASTTSARKHHQAQLQRRAVALKDLILFMENEHPLRKSKRLYLSLLE